MRKPLTLAMAVLLAGCGTFQDDTPAVTGAATSSPPEPPAAVKPAPRREAAVTTPQPKPRTVLHLVVEPADVRLEQALREALLNRAPHLDLRRGGKPAEDAALLSLRQFRWNEDERTEAVRTVTYRADQVAGHTLPAGAVYQVDHLTGKAVMGVSFHLTLERGGKRLAAGEVGDRQEAPWSRCRLARIVEPSGSTRAAGFVANPEMQALCSGKAAAAVPAVTVAKLAEAVLALPLNGK